MIIFEVLRSHKLESAPFDWGHIQGLYRPADAELLASTFPHDRYKLIEAYGGEKDYRYEARALVSMGAREVSAPERLSPAWRELAADLISPEYRSAMSELTGRDLSDTQIEVNVFHYPPGGSLGPHKDLPEKLVTHVLYFNRTWDPASGGCLNILRSNDPADLAAIVPPIVGSSAVIVRSDSSWHAVSPVIPTSNESRRSMTVTFYPRGAVSSMWPPGDPTPLHDYATNTAPHLG